MTGSLTRMGLQPDNGLSTDPRIDIDSPPHLTDGSQKWIYSLIKRSYLISLRPNEFGRLTDWTMTVLCFCDQKAGSSSMKPDSEAFKFQRLTSYWPL